MEEAESIDRVSSTRHEPARRSTDTNLVLEDHQDLGDETQTQEAVRKGVQMYAIVSYEWKAYSVTMLVKNEAYDIKQAKKKIEKSIISNGWTGAEVYEDSFKVDEIDLNDKEPIWV